MTSRKKPSGSQFAKRRRLAVADSERSATMMKNFLGVQDQAAGAAADLPPNPTLSSTSGIAPCSSTPLPDPDSLAEGLGGDGDGEENDGVESNGATADELESRNVDDQDPQDPSAPVCDFSAVAAIGKNELSIKDRDGIILAHEEYQHKSGPFEVRNGRRINEGWFATTSKPGGMPIKRSWLMYSPIKNSLYCLPCILYGSTPKNSLSALESASGFTRFQERCNLTTHENTEWHCRAFLQWKEAELRLKTGRAIDDQALKAIEDECALAKKILTSVVACVKYLAINDLALQGKDTSGGNFRELVRLLSDFDPVLKAHLETCERKSQKGKVTYLSNTIQNQIIQLMAARVRNALVTQIQEGRYFTIMVDSTPDAARHDQFSFVVRHVVCSPEQVEVKESFLGFRRLNHKTGEGIAEGILTVLAELGLDFNLCRGICFDNANVMAGIRGGAQAFLAKKNPFATFINCDNHSLNLAGKDALSIHPMTTTFFAHVESTYNFFARSTARWGALEKAGVHLQRATDTRWSSQANAIAALKAGLNEILGVLEGIELDPAIHSEVRGEARTVLQGILKYEFLVCLHFWDQLLGKIDLAQKKLQTKGISIVTAQEHLAAVENFILSNRDDLVNDAFSDGAKLCEMWSIPLNTQRVRRRKRLDPDESPDTPITAQNELRRLLLESLDVLRGKLGDRNRRLSELVEQLGPFCQPTVLFSATNEALGDLVDRFVARFPADADSVVLRHELVSLVPLMKSHPNPPKTGEELLQYLANFDEDVCPNLRSAVRILLTLGASIAGCERSFSKLKLILSYLRTTMTQERLDSLALLSIEKKTTKASSYDATVSDFVNAKVRRTKF